MALSYIRRRRWSFPQAAEVDGPPSLRDIADPEMDAQNAPSLPLFRQDIPSEQRKSEGFGTRLDSRNLRGVFHV